MMSELRAGLVDSLRLGLAAVNVYESPQVGTVSVPGVVVMGPTISRMVMGGTFEVNVEIWVIVRHDAIDELDLLIDPTLPGSVPAVLESNPTLGGVVGSLELVEIGTYRDITVGGTELLGATVRLEVFS